LCDCNDNHKGNIDKIYTKGNEKLKHVTAHTQSQQNTNEDSKREKETHKKATRQETNQMAIVSPSPSVITLNVNGLNKPIKDTDWLNGFF